MRSITESSSAAEALRKAAVRLVGLGRGLHHSLFAGGLGLELAVVAEEAVLVDDVGEGGCFGVHHVQNNFDAEGDEVAGSEIEVVGMLLDGESEFFGYGGVKAGEVLHKTKSCLCGNERQLYY